MTDDTVRRQVAIDAIVNSVSEIGLHDNSEVARYGATFRQHEIIDIIEGLPSAQQWIPVAERIPEQRDLVLIMYYTNKGRHFYGVDFYNGVGFITENVTHWMPLPDPPKGEDNERTD